MEEVVKEAEIVTETPIVETVVTPQPGEKTDSALLLKSLQEEREKRRLADAEVERLTALHNPDDIVSDEGRAILGKLAPLQAEIATLKLRETMNILEASYPALKDKQAEFQTYLQENPGVRPEIAAKAFLVDHNLFEAPARKGLENSTGGAREPQKTGMSAEDIDNLRNTNYRKFSDMVRKGQITFD